jgi:hypothetical protein
MNQRQQRRAASTLVETMISLGIFVIAGGLIYTALNTGAILFAKNTSINSAHQSAVKVINHITRDIHRSASTPELVDVNSAPTSGPAAGISVQPVAAGPYTLVGGVALDLQRSRVTIATTIQPQVGQRLISPALLIEDYITAVAANATNPATQTDLTLTNAIWTSGLSPSSMYYVAFITNRAVYVVVGDELRYYAMSTGSSADTYIVLAKGVATPTPFTITNSATGLPTNRTVAAQLAVKDPTYNNRGYRTTDMSVTFQVPYRALIALYP